MTIYKKSWVNKYFNVEALAEEGLVFFYDNSPANKCRFLSTRFTVDLKLPEITKTYFKPDTFWNTAGYEINEWIPAHALSTVLHGTLSNNAPGTKMVIYDPPYFLRLKIQGLSSNYFAFNDNKPSSEFTILSMLRYDDSRLMLKDEYSTEWIFPYKEELCLTEVLEFTLHDSQNKIVQVADKSQLFVLLTLL
ncbi:MAG: hypothetical protein WCJ72_05725 [Chryseobacterium sp.]